MARISFSENDGLHFLGRNGIGKCRGVSIQRASHVIYLEPVTSKGDLGRSQIQMPADPGKVIDVASALASEAGVDLASVLRQVVVAGLRFEQAGGRVDEGLISQWLKMAASGQPIGVGQIQPDAVPLDQAIEQIDAKSAWV